MGDQFPGGVRLFMRVGDGDELLVGVAKSLGHVPELLHAVADGWSRRAEDGKLYDRLAVGEDDPGAP